MSDINQSNISTTEITTDKLTIGGVTAEGIVAPTTKLNSTIPASSLITAGCLNSALEMIYDDIAKFDPSGNMLRDLAMISLSLVDPYFTRNSDWESKNWILSGNEMYAVGGYKDNYLTIRNSSLLRNGRYLINLVIRNIPSGKLELRLNDEWIATFDKPGIYYKDFYIGDFTQDKITLTAIDVSARESIEVYSYSLHYIAERFYSFVVKKVKELATVDTEGFVPREEYIHTLDEFIVQFQEATKQYIKALTMHVTAANPHGITPELIGAAKTDHTHSQYLTKSQLQAEVSEQMTDYAKYDHVHDDYLKLEAVNTVVVGILNSYISQMISVKPLILTNGPTAELPSRFAQTDISESAMLLLPSTIFHNGYTSYDTNYGNITTNKVELIQIAPTVFAGGIAEECQPEQLARIPFTLESNINLRIRYHYPRKVKGYRIYITDASLVSWNVFSGSSTFLHSITEVPEKKVQDNGIGYYELFLENVTTAPSLSFTLDEIVKESDSDTWGLYIEIMYSDFDTNSFGIVKDYFQCCVPVQGSNRLIYHEESLDHFVITPEHQIKDLPLYVYARQNFDEANMNFVTSYYPPEYGNTRKGRPLFIDNFDIIEAKFSSGHEYYAHPAFGTLTLKEGASFENNYLNKIYNSSTEGWKSDGYDKQIVIEQTFNSKNVILSAYMLSWRNEDSNFIPISWTLTVDGRDEKGKPVTIVYDSVEEYYPFYSVEDDDIVYYKKLDNLITVDKVTLSMIARGDATPIALNKLFLYISERYYSIPQNRMYLGLAETSEMCIGSATYKGTTQGYITDNIYFGSSCVVPINHLEVTELGGQYTITNPYFTKDITAVPQNYSLTQEDSNMPQIYITNMTDREISVYTEAPFRHAIAISRSW